MENSQELALNNSNEETMIEKKEKTKTYKRKPTQKQMETMKNNMKKCNESKKKKSTFETQLAEIFDGTKEDQEYSDDEIKQKVSKKNLESKQSEQNYKRESQSNYDNHFNALLNAYDKIYQKIEKIEDKTTKLWSCKKQKNNKVAPVIVEKHVPVRTHSLDKINPYKNLIMNKK